MTHHHPRAAPEREELRRWHGWMFQERNFWSRRQIILNPTSIALLRGGGLLTLFLSQIPNFLHTYSSGWYGRYAEVACHAEAHRCNWCVCFIYKWLMIPFQWMRTTWQSWKSSEMTSVKTVEIQNLKCRRILDDHVYLSELIKQFCDIHSP